MQKNNTTFKIRNAVANDLTAINEIYNYYVKNSTCTYQTELETMKERHAWFDEHDKAHPVIVAENNDTIVGWASISKFRKREAYKPTVENSVYIHHDHLYKGIGTALLQEIIRLARDAGHHSIIAGISAEQTKSIAMHEKYGFKKVAHLKEVGYKFNTWLDVVYYQLFL
jgi:L-amino acid N-acyltransferase YncA